MMLFILSIGMTLSGCSSTQDETIQNLQNQNSKLQDDLAKCQNNKAELKGALGQGESKFEKQNNISIAIIVVVFVIVFVIVFLFLFRFYHKKESEHRKEIGSRQNIINDLKKSIFSLEMDINKLKQSIEEGEKNEVSTLIKQLKAEREAGIQDICKEYNDNSSKTNKRVAL